MKSKRHDVSNAVISLFKQGQINCRNMNLAKSVCSAADRIISIFKRNSTNSDSTAQMNAIRLGCKKLAPIKASVTVDIVRRYILTDAINNKDVQGGYIQIKKMQAPNKSNQFRNNEGFYRLKVLRRENAQV